MREFYAVGSGGQYDMQFTHILDVPMALNSDGTRPAGWRNIAKNYVRSNYSLEPDSFDSNIFDVNATSSDPGQGWAGVYHGGNEFSIQANIATNWGKIVLDHELGHRVSADHAKAFRQINNADFTPYVWNDSSQQYEVYNSATHGYTPLPFGVREDTYGNPFDTMGNISDGAFRIREKLTDLGWLTNAQVPDLNTLGAGTYRIYAHNELQVAISSDPDPIYGVVETYDPTAYYGLTFQRPAERFNRFTGVFENYTQRIDLEYRVNDNGNGRDGVQFFLDGTIVDLDSEGGTNRNNTERELEIGKSISDIEFGMSMWNAGDDGDGDFLSYNPPPPSDPVALRGDWFNFNVLSNGVDSIGSYIELAVTTESPFFDRLVWNTGSGNFDSGFARSDGLGGVGAMGLDPFDYGGTENLYLGNGGFATLDASTDMSSGNAIASLRLGTDQASDIIDGGNGFGVLTVNDAVSLTVGDGNAQVGEVGDFTVAEGGFQGQLNWNSSGTLNVEGKFRVGQGGQGLVEQNGGTIVAGNTAGSDKFVGVGVGPGSDGSNYTLNNGLLIVGGGLTAGQLRELRIGSNASAQFTLGDGTGAAGSAKIETRRHIQVGHNGGTGVLIIDSDGQIEQVTSGAPLIVGASGGSQGTVTQTGGTVTNEHQLRIGDGVGSVGSYTISGGTLSIATDNSGHTRIGENGGTGTLRIEGTASVTAGAELFVGHTDNVGSTGTLELIGSNASLSVANLDNALGAEETIFWQADVTGITPLVVRGDVGSSLFVELQHPMEIAANSGGMGDGIALDLDLSQLAGGGTLTLIDNQSSEAIQGFFENPLVPSDLLLEGELLTGTGYSGTVSISYVGGTGNDVVLLLDSGADNADFNSDNRVDGRDFLTWQRNPSVGSLDDWNLQYGNSLVEAAASVPEPTCFALLAASVLTIFSRRSQ